MAKATTPYPLKWPANRPRRKPADRKNPVFWTKERYGGHLSGAKPITVAVALERLERQLDALGARYPVVSTNLEVRINGLPRLSQPEPADPGVSVYFDLGGKPHCLPCDTYTTVAANIAAIAAHIEATRKIERYGIASTAEMFEGFLALPSPSDTRPWREVLEIHRKITVNMRLVEEAYRRLARERHPDRGGSDAMMAELNAARASAREELDA